MFTENWRRIILGNLRQFPGNGTEKAEPAQGMVACTSLLEIECELITPNYSSAIDILSQARNIRNLM
jgi:hypothetical protein